MNLVGRYVQTGNCLLYADDLTIVLKDTDLTKLNRKLIKTLSNFEKWLTRTGFKLSAAKN